MIHDSVHILIMWFVQYLLISMSVRYSVFRGSYAPEKLSADYHIQFLQRICDCCGIFITKRFILSHD